MRRADSSVYASENDFAFGRKMPQILDHFAHSRVPVSHDGLHQCIFKRPFAGKEFLKLRPRQPKTAVMPRHVSVNGGLGDDFRTKLSAPPGVAAASTPWNARIEPVHKIKQPEVRLTTQESRGSDHPIGLKPEIVRGEIVDRR